jgi:soluble lytic murein transglycosylase-like protein
MDVVIRAIGLFFFLITSMARAGLAPSDIESALDRWQPLIDKAAERFAIPAPWIREVMRLESAGQAFLDGQPTTSSAGAVGLMQLMPATYADLRERYGFGADSFDPHDNIFAGAAYLRELYERYGWPSLFAAYHAGPARFEAYLSTGKSLPKATRKYLAALVPARSIGRASAHPTASIVMIFVPLSRSDRVADSATGVTPNDRLFVRLKARRIASERLTGDGDDASQERPDANGP